MPSPDPVPSTGGRLLLQVLRGRGRRLALFLVLISTWQVCEALVPVLIGVTIDRAVATGDAGQLALWLVVLVLLFAVLSYSYRIGAQVAFRVGQEAMHDLRMRVARKALDPRGTRNGLLPGETLSLATSDVELIGVTLRVVGYAVASAVAVVVSAVLLLRIDLVLGLVVLLGVPVVLVLLQVLTPVIARRSSAQQALLARATGVATDLVRGFRSLKGIGAEQVAAERYRRESARARDAGVRTANSYGVMAGLTTGAAALFLAVVAVLAGVLAVEGRISVGELVAIVGLTQFLAEPMRILGDLLAELAAARASAQRIVDHLASPPLVPAGDADGGEPARELELLDLHAGGLRGLTLAARPGELLGVVVIDAAEAATLVGVLAGEVIPDDPDSVRLDDLPLADHTVGSRRRRLLVAPHHVDLFEGTIADNIDPDGRHDEARLEVLVGAAAVEDVLRLHPDGLHRAVTPDGATYSGGQRQRVAYARALATDAPVLVLHDPTTAVDAVTEHRMARGLRTARDGLTTWVLTSSPALLAQADRVALVVDGRVVAAGTHADLVARDDYREAVLR
ncbi:ABC transporter transmembrane domain-containing protein [Nocardioides marmoraquaticus]